MQMIQPQRYTRSQAIMALTRALTSRDSQKVSETANDIMDAYGPTTNLSGAKRLLVEAAAAIVEDGQADSNVIPTTFRFFAAFDFECLMAHAYGPATQDDNVRQRAIAYLRRIGVDSPKTAINDPNCEDQHELVAHGVRQVFA